MMLTAAFSVLNVLLLLMPALAVAQVEGSAVKVLPVTAEQTATGVRLKIEGSGPLSATVFQLAEPRRLIVDIVDADINSAGVAEVYEDAVTGVNGITAFRTTQYGPEAGSIGRLEFSLSEGFTHSSTRDGNVVLVELVRTAGQPVGERSGEDAVVLPAGKEQPDSKPYKAKPKWTGYSFIDISIYNFDAVDIPSTKATVYGLSVVGGFRIGEIVSFEGSVNWFPFMLPPIPVPLPFPLLWLPSEGGFYLNLAGGMRFNLVKYSSHDTVPWVSAWSVGHAVLSDFSVNGNGVTYGIGVDIKGKKDRTTQLALRIHNFDGDLEIYEGDYSFEYGRQKIRAVELVIGFTTK